MFFWDDFSNDPVVVAMDDAARGIYMMLLCSLWFQPVPGTVEENIPILARLSRTTPDQITKFWPQIKPAFKEVGGEGMLVQERLVHTYKKAMDSLLGNRERKAKWRGNQVKINKIKNSSGTVPETFLERSGSVSVSGSINTSITKKEKHKVSRELGGSGGNETATRELGVCRQMFAEFWSLYPKKIERSEAEKVFLKLRPSKELFSKIISAVEGQKNSSQWTNDDGKFVPYAAKWLNKKRWEDEPSLFEDSEEAKIKRIAARMEEKEKNGR